MTKFRYTMFAVTFFLVLALSAMSTVPALADDSTPPPAETPTVETAPTEEGIEEVVPIEEISAVEESIIEETATQEETTAEILASVPEGTDVVVVNEDGETVPLVTQEAAEIIATNDPQWCPVGVAPNSVTCSGVKDSFNGGNANTDLIAWLLANQPNKAGVIWIEAGYVGNIGVESTAIELDGDDFATMDNFALTINGGWTGTGSTLNPNTPSTFNVSLSIINWSGDITLNNITFTGVATGSTTNSAALEIETTKKITLTNVKVNNNTGAGTVNGAYLINADSDPLVFGDVSITNSQFNDNKNRGLQVFSEGMITLANVLVNGNDAGGANLNNANAATAKAVTITTGTNEFSNNINIGTGDGLNIASKGIITLKDITANNNGGDGLHLDNRYGTFVSGITLSGATIASQNNDDGIEAYSDGTITASNLVTNTNDGRGTYLDNDAAATALGVTISGSSNQFKFNGAAGLFVTSDGAIIVNSITANNNNGEGANLYNQLLNVTMTGTNYFNNNSNDGLYISSGGIVTLSNITANDNSNTFGYGVRIDNYNTPTPKAATLTGVNQFNGNHSGGIQITSLGAITISNLTANNNSFGAGAVLVNSSGTSPQNVTLTGTTNVNNNTTGSGLFIHTLGAISIGNITANNNGGDGVNLHNRTGTAPKAVTLSGATNNFNGNATNGLIIQSLGAVTLNNVTATFNTNGCGICVNNNYALAVGGITLNGTSYVDSNGKDGIRFESKGNIQLKDLDSTNNGVLESLNYTDGYGVYLDNDSGTGNVTLGTSKAGWFNDLSGNFLSGLQIYSNGTVTLSNITSNGNGGDNGTDTPYGYGLFVDNSTASTPKNVTLLGENDFSGNETGGLTIATKGAVLLNKITSEENNGIGVFIANATNNLVPQNVTLNGYGEFSANTGRGLEIHTFGIVTLNSIYASGNGNDGFFIDNYTGAIMVRAVTINGYANAYNNNGYGLHINSLGAIKINNLDASFGNLVGAYLDNNEAGAVGGITLTGSNSFDLNSQHGLIAESRGAILINDLDASGNTTGFGVYVDNTSAATPQGVTFTNASTNSSLFADNGASGLYLLTKGAVTITNLMATGNGARGAYIRNTYSGTGSPQNITLNGYGQFYGNGDDGLLVITYGAILTNNLTANDNGQNGGSVGYGVWLDNCDYTSACNAVTAKSVTMNGTNTFNNNNLNGLLVQSLGVIKGNNVTASNNDQNGAVLNNGWLFGYIGVTLTGTNIFENNGVDGLDISTNGVVSLNNISANGNVIGNGVAISAVNDNTPPGRNGPPNITITGVNNFNGNGGRGLLIQSNGLVTLNNVTANDNGLEGAYVDNFVTDPDHWYPIPANTFSLLGINNFNGNSFNGLYFYTYGGANITNITADNNGGDGVEGVSVKKGITIACGSMTNNSNYGWQLDATGTITLKGVFTIGNGVGPFFNTVGTVVSTRTC